ncbi:MAG TPA: tetratricopeptide repeat protein [Bacteroidetes bacterium]|nr:tetratricopeptide repeat protein [Bacteroidota bacterium]
MRNFPNLRPENQSSKMSKRPAKRKQQKKVVPKATVKRTKPKTAKPNPWLNRPSVASEQDPFYKKVFTGLAIVFLLLTMLLAYNGGINGDDEYQDKYSTDLVNYYSTFGADTSALYIKKGNMHYYGGFFDTVTGFTNKALGLEMYDAAYHDVRHIFNAVIGFLAMLFTALLAKEIAGWRAGILTLAFMFLSPRFLGHSIMNPKDIPFALGYIASIYYMARLFKNMPGFNWKLALGVALGMALAIATRAGGFILVGILGLYAGLDFLTKKGMKGLGDVKTVGLYAANVVGISLVALLVAVLFWPYALQAPFSNPFEALGAFEKLAVKIRVLFDGVNIMSDNTPWDYPLQWIWRTVPMFTLIGFLGSLALLPQLIKKYRPVPVVVALFAAVFPVFYVIYKDAILHDGWRHLTFVYPTMVVMAALFFVTLESILKENKMGKYGLYVALALLVLEPAVYIARNSQFPYTYFNPLSGGISHAFGNYETDYWGVSVRQALEWMEDEGILSQDMPEKITIATSFIHNARAYVGQKYKGKLSFIYQRFNKRYERPWDYGIFPSRYLKGPHLRSGSWPNSRSIHTVTANGVPLVSVEKGGGAVFRAEEAFKKKDYPAAITDFKEEVKEHPDNELAWMKLAMCYVNTGNFQAAKDAADNMLKVTPDNTSGLFYRGIAQLNSGNTAGAEADFRRAIEVEEDFSTAYYYLALIQYNRQDVQGALDNIQKTLQLNPRFKPAYELWAQILEGQGNTQRATQIRSAAAKL